MAFCIPLGCSHQLSPSIRKSHAHCWASPNITPEEATASHSTLITLTDCNTWNPSVLPLTHSQTLWSSHTSPTKTALRTLSEQSTPCSPHPVVASMAQAQGWNHVCKLPCKSLGLPLKEELSMLIALTHESAHFHTEHNLLIWNDSSLIANVFSLLLVCLTLSSHPTDGCMTKLLSHSHCLWITLSPRPQTHYNYSAGGAKTTPALYSSFKLLSLFPVAAQLRMNCSIAFSLLKLLQASPVCSLAPYSRSK